MKLTIVFILCLFLVACSQTDTPSVGKKDPVSEIDKKEKEPVIVEGEWNKAEREDPKIGEALFIKSENVTESQ